MANKQELSVPPFQNLLKWTHRNEDFVSLGYLHVHCTLKMKNEIKLKIKFNTL